ncbi:MAG: Stp1/IreP family PP2C-type Ser/Thr phosphatase [Myxococcales bacterium]|nr:Stp1/IreP family PP2C-type Ser/Thr phosphatase [Myxococcales bacterium]MCB9521574.1 Stp1/IreP family PP2C-type Ser/Thr phosphatase [Myxococcales bacterium]MCB9530570.1 Stp1/IreP family PP2C-type Ser/Thr phosphatase [Myxococcales bacterium]MCB9534481.1 Stp1/IreP family PP2C-type Ser/Thr phosphatase [Myxococcales bacterium]
MKLEYAGQTDVGLKRGHNEDSFSVLSDLGLYMVADGMGGHSAGEVASRMACEAIASFFRETEEDDEMTWPYKMEKGLGYEANRLAVGVKLANLRIHECAQSNASQRGMGTTIVGMRFTKDGFVVGHVGDSRVYRVRDEQLEQLTEDHSLLNDYIKMKELTAEEIANFPHKNVIVRALGMKDTVQVDLRTDAARAGDLYLLCSDGLSGMLPDDRLRSIVVESAGRGLDEACRALIDAANAAGGTDNITVVLVRVAAV